MSWSRLSQSMPPLAIGLLLLLLGGLLLADNLEVFDQHHWLPWFWPFGAFSLAVAFLLRGPSKSDLVKASIAALVGVFLLARAMGFLAHVEIDLGDLLVPALLLFIGARLLMRSHKRGDSDTASPSGATERAEADIEGFALLGGNTLRSTSQSFRRGDLTAVMGGCVLDLRNARATPDGAVVDCFAFWGGIGINVPPGWIVESEVMPILAGFADETKPPIDPSAATGRLRVRGYAIMGGIGVDHGESSSAS